MFNFASQISVEISKLLLYCPCPVTITQFLYCTVQSGLTLAAATSLVFSWPSSEQHVICNWWFNRDNSDNTSNGDITHLYNHCLHSSRWERSAENWHLLLLRPRNLYISLAPCTLSMMIHQSHVVKLFTPLFCLFCFWHCPHICKRS